MSMIKCTRDGYGFPIRNNNDKHIIEFLYHNKEYVHEAYQPKIGQLYTELQNDSLEENVLDDALDYLVPHLVAQCANELFNLGDFIEGFPSDPNCDTEEHIGFPKTYTWQLTEKQKQIDLKRAEQIMIQIANKLGVSEQPDEFTLHYWN